MRVEEADLQVAPVEELDRQLEVLALVRVAYVQCLRSTVVLNPRYLYSPEDDHLVPAEVELLPFLVGVAYTDVGDEFAGLLLGRPLEFRGEIKLGRELGPFLVLLVDFLDPLSLDLPAVSLEVDTRRRTEEPATRGYRISMSCD